MDALTLFDDTGEAADGDEGGDADVDLTALIGENDDDWIIDDVGDGMKDTVDMDFGKSGLREMGMYFNLSAVEIRTNFSF